MSLLEVESVSKCFASAGATWFGRTLVPAVRGISFELEEGRTLALIGESGAGKSTAARLVARLIEPDSGSIRFAGEDWLALDARQLRARRAHMQMVFQDPYGSLDPRVSIGASVAEPLLVHTRLGRRERNDRAAAMLERVGLSASHAVRYPRELSGGQLQRAAIARALCTKPKLIICDEPVAALDVLIRAQVLNLMRDLQEEFRLAYLFITHDLSIVRAFADTVVVMQAGQVVERAPVAQLFNAAVHPYTRALLEAIPKNLPKAVQ
jgi:oligopeptide transport system ATP-binding protein